MNVAIIPARGGSKRIPRKNIKAFAGKPIISWSIKAALESDCFDQVIVSTDDSEIADIAIKYGADVPFLRPEKLSDDFTGTIPVIRHAIKQLCDKSTDVENVCCIYATAPFLCIEDLRRGLEILLASNSLFSFAVTRFPFPIQRALKINERDRVEMFQPEYFHTRSQDLEESWHDAGQFYWGKVAAWLDEDVLFGSNSSPVKLPMYRVQDLDTYEDWERAELMYRVLKQLDGPA